MTDDRRMQSFETPTPVRLRVDIPKGRIRIVAEETGATRVELLAVHGDATARAWIADAEITQVCEEISVRVRKTGPRLFGIGGAIHAEVHLPLSSAVKLSTGSGRIETVGRLGEVSASSGSGVVKLDDCAENHTK